MTERRPGLNIKDEQEGAIAIPGDPTSLAHKDAPCPILKNDQDLLATPGFLAFARTTSKRPLE